MGDYRDDEGPFTEVGGRRCHGLECHVAVRERPTTDFEAPGLQAWIAQANVDPKSSIQAARGYGFPRVMSIVTLDCSLLARG